MKRVSVARFDHDFAAETIANFDADLVAVDDQRPARQAIETRSAVALQFILDVALLGIRSERRVTEVLAGVLRFEACESTAVARQLGHGHPVSKSPNSAANWRRSSFRNNLRVVAASKRCSVASPYSV